MRWFRTEEKKRKAKAKAAEKAMQEMRMREMMMMEVEDLWAGIAEEESVLKERREAEGGSSSSVGTAIGFVESKTCGEGSDPIFKIERRFSIGTPKMLLVRLLPLCVSSWWGFDY